jgi:beta propeller repeat protein
VVSFCGDGYCAANENSSTCCIDCACPTGLICSNNTCKSSFLIKPIIVVPISPEKKISENTVTELAKPRISDYFVAWNEYFSGDSDIMLYNLQRIETPSTQYHPDVSAKRLVWTDYRRPVQGDNSDIYYYDLVSGTEGFVTSRIEYKWGAAIDGNYITWIEQDGYKKYVYLFGIVSATETKLTSSDIYPEGLDVSGTNVVYGHFNCDTGTCYYGIKLYNTASKKTTSIIDTTGDIDYYNVRIHGNKVVYISGKDANTQINVYDISSKITTQITSSSGEKDYPSIYQDKVVWMDNRNGNWDIYMYDLSTKQETALVTESHDQKYPDVYGNKVVYQDKRDGRHIYMYTLSN